MKLKIKGVEFEVSYLDRIDIKQINLIPPRVSMVLANYPQKMVMVNWLKPVITIFFAIDKHNDVGWTGVRFKVRDDKSINTNFKITNRARQVLRLVAVVFHKINQKKALKWAHYFYGGPAPILKNKKKPQNYQKTLDFKTLAELVACAENLQQTDTQKYSLPKKKKARKKINKNQLDFFELGESMDY